MSRAVGVAIHEASQPRVVCRIERETVQVCARLIANRIREIVRARGCGVMLFIDEAGDARIVHEEHRAAHAWFRDKFRDYVGLYRIGTHARSLEPSITGIAEDVADHMGFA